MHLCTAEQGPREAALRHPVAVSVVVGRGLPIWGVRTAFSPGQGSRSVLIPEPTKQPIFHT